MLLAVDTATRTIGIAVYDGARVLAESLWLGGRHHTISLAPEVAMMLRKVDLSAQDLSAVAVASGPGSYTGLRIGVSFAKGLALAHNLPMVGIPTLDILAHGQPRRKEPMLVIIEAGRGRVAGMWYKWGRLGWRAQAEPENFTWTEIRKQFEKKSYLCGEIDVAERKALSDESKVILASPANCIRRPSVLAELAWEKVRKGKGLDPASIVPQYLDSQG